jgi:hypothetical protein
MKKITLTFLLLGAFVAKAQEVQNDTIKPVTLESLKELVDDHSMKFSGLEERLSLSDAILDKLSKIKISGYIQAQYEMYDNWSANGKVHGVAPTSGVRPITNSFFIRRARVKFTYEALDGVKFVLCPDFTVDKFSLKDAYAVLNDRWTNTFSLWVGQFNRITYDNEFSSASREFAERTLLTRTLYPTEREVGVKLEADFNTKYNFPLKLQFAIFNGNFGEGAVASQQKDVDDAKDFMARAVYSLKLPSKGLGIDFGGHTYIGKTTFIALDPTPANNIFTDVNNVSFTPAIGDRFNKQLFSGEMQVYYDLLGGISLKSEYIRGTYSGTINAAQLNSLFSANKVRNVEGYYISLVKNIGNKYEASVRYDVFDPNTKLSGDAVKTKDDLKYNNWTFAWQYHFDESVKIMACYVMPINEKSLNAGADFIKDKHDNTFTLRLQARF